jgi:hypothetical protein
MEPDVVDSCHMPPKKMMVRAAWIAAGVCSLAVVLLAVEFHRSGSTSAAPNSWNSGAIHGTLAAVRVRELDPAHAAVIFFYDLENRTDSDYRLSSGPNVVIMSRLQSGGILSSDQQITLDAAAFVPAKNRTRIALEITHGFEWPAQRDAAAEKQLRQFVVDQVSGLEGFVLFDQGTRYQIELATSTPELQTESAPSRQN